MYTMGKQPKKAAARPQVALRSWSIARCCSLESMMLLTCTLAAHSSSAYLNTRCDLALAVSGEESNVVSKAEPLSENTGGSTEALQQTTVGKDETRTERTPRAEKFPSKGTDIHTLCTSNGSPYLNFQTRIMYARLTPLLC